MVNSSDSVTQLGQQEESKLLYSRILQYCGLEQPGMAGSPPICYCGLGLINKLGLFLLKAIVAAAEIYNIFKFNIMWVFKASYF